MDHETYHRLIRNEIHGPLASTARAALAIAAGGYGIGVALRDLAYNRGWFPTHRIDLPIISVGNITLGGTGKTPTVEWVARRLRQSRLRVVILSRGYKGTEGLNDEGRVLDQNLPDVPHLQDRDRVTLARIAREELESQVAVLDDGFQHRRLARDLDIVLIDALDPFGQRRLFPRGLLREPIRSLRRAGILLMSRADLVAEEARRVIRRDIERASVSAPWVESRQAPLDLIDETGRSEPLQGLEDRGIVAFCGIGNPGGFRKTLETLGINPIAFQVFPDHHNYTRADVDGLAAMATRSGAELLLTTQKDLVKLRAPSLGGVPLRALRIGLELLEGGEFLEAAIDQVADRIPRQATTWDEGIAPSDS